MNEAWFMEATVIWEYSSPKGTGLWSCQKFPLRHSAVVEVWVDLTGSTLPDPAQKVPSSSHSQSLYFQCPIIKSNEIRKEESIDLQEILL